MRITRRLVDQHPLWVGETAAGQVLAGSDPTALAPADAALLQAPELLCVSPSKIVCIGLNYRRHAEEMGKPLPKEPVIFMKPTTALIGPGETIRRPAISADVHYEGELAIVIGRRATAVSVAEADAHVLGFTLMNDVTARDLQRADARYTRAKGFDTFAPCGPAIVTGLDPRALTIRTWINGELRQESSCDDMIFTVAECIAYVSSIMTLLPGDIISTGTPAGVGALASGDTVRIGIEGIGMLENPVV
jgi:2-keto-4-pentenoate hydratase/2-oxohepta-3-ene-1,7-dioic acid hydratase in catechol pathway